jgi:hypothetical protein
LTLSVLQSIHGCLLDADELSLDTGATEVRSAAPSAASSAGCATAAPPDQAGACPQRAAWVGAYSAVACARASHACSARGRLLVVPRGPHALDGAAGEGPHDPPGFGDRLGRPRLQFEEGTGGVASLPGRFLREVGDAQPQSGSGSRDQVATRTTGCNQTNGQRRRPQPRPTFVLWIRSRAHRCFCIGLAPRSKTGGRQRPPRACRNRRPRYFTGSGFSLRQRLKSASRRADRAPARDVGSSPAGGSRGGES